MYILTSIEDPSRVVALSYVMVTSGQVGESTGGAIAIASWKSSTDVSDPNPQADIRLFSASSTLTCNDMSIRVDQWALFVPGMGEDLVTY